MKTCTKCGETKPLTEFYAQAASKDGRTGACKACIRERCKRHCAANRDKEAARKRRRRVEHPEELSAYRRQYYAANRDMFITSVQRWRAGHPEEAVAYSQRYYRANRDRILAALQVWCRANPVKCSEYKHRHRARQEGNGGSFTVEEWAELCSQFNSVCLRCGKQVALTVDHVVPLSRGGNNDIGNLQPLCKSCNSSKGARPIDYRVRYAVEHWYSHF